MAPCAAALAVLHGPALLAGRVYFHGDLTFTTHPWMRFAADQLQAGRLPLWDPYDSLGLPFLGNMQSGLFFPPSLFFFLLSYAAALWAFLIAVCGFAALGGYLWLRAAGLSRPACAAAACVFVLGGYIQGHLEFTSQVATLAHLPWALLLAPAPLAGTIVFASAAWASYAPFWALIAAVSLAVVAAASGPRAAARASLLPALGLALAAQATIPGLELLRSSSRAAGLPRAERLAYSMSRSDLAAFISPELARRLSGLDSADARGVQRIVWDSPRGKRNFVLPEVSSDGLRGPWGVKYSDTKSCYLGFSGAFLSLLGFVALLRKGSRAAAGAAALAGLGILLCLGDSTAASLWVWGRIPPLRFLREPNRLAWLTSCSAAYLAAEGVEGMAGRFARFGRLAALAVVVAELTAAGWRYYPSVPRGYYAEKGPLIGYLQPRLQGWRYVQVPDIYSWRDPDPRPAPEGYDEFRMEMFRTFKARGHASSTLPYRLSQMQISHYLSLVPTETRRALDSLKVRLAEGGGLEAPLKWACARFVSHYSMSLPGESALPYRGLHMWHMFENPETASCAYWVPPEFSAVLGRPLSEAPRTISEVPWEVERPREDRVVARGLAARAGTLFLSEPRYPGWEAYLNGRRVPTKRAMGAFTAVDVPAGSSELRLLYRPLSLRIGLWASLAAALAIICAGVRLLIP